MIWDAHTGRRIRSLAGHEKQVRLVRFAGKLVVSSSDDRTIRVWDPESGKCLRVMPGLDARCLAVSPDGKTLAVGRGLFTLPSGKQIWDVGPLAGSLRSAAYSGDGKLLVFGLDNGQVLVIRAPSGRLVHTLTGQSGVLSHNGKQLATLSDSWKLVFRSLSTGVELKRYRRVGRVRTLLYSPDGALLATSGIDGKIRIWNAKTCKPVRILEGLGRLSYCLSFSADGKRLAAGGLSGQVELWQVATGKRLNPVEPHRGGALSVAFGADGISATGGRGGGVEIWKTGKRVKTLTKTGRPVRLLAFSVDGRQLASAGNIRIWNVRTGKLTRRFQTSAYGMRSMQFSRDGTRLLTVGLERFGLNWWGVTDGKLKLEVPGAWWPAREAARIRPDGSALLVVKTRHAVHSWTRLAGWRSVSRSGLAGSMTLTSDGRQLAIAAPDRGIELWDTASGNTRLVIDRVAKCLAFSPDGRVLAAASGAGGVRLYATQDGRALRKLRFDGGPTVQLAFSRDGRKLAAVSALGTVVLHDLPAFTPVPAVSDRPSRIQRRLTNPRPCHPERVTSIRFSPAGDTFVTRSGDAIRLWDVATARLRLRIDGSGDERFRFSPGGGRLAVATRDRIVRIWDTVTGRVLAVCVGHEGDVLALDWSPDGRLLATGGRDRVVHLWASASGKRLRVLTGGARRPFTALAFSPDGKSLATANEDRRIRRFETASGKLLQVILTEAGMTALSYSPDGQTLVGLAQAWLWLWNLNSGKLRPGFAGLTPVDSLAFSADSKQLALGRGSRLQLWELSKARVIRSLTMPGAYSSTVHFTRAGRLVGSLRGKKGSLRSWDLRSGKSLYRASSSFVALDLSPDGRLMALADADAGLRLVKLATGARLAHFARPRRVNSLAFSPDGRALALTQGEQLRLIDLASGRSKRLLTRQRGRLNVAAFDPTGSWIASGGEDAMIRLSPVRPAKPDPAIGQLIAQLGARRFKQRKAALLRLRGMGLKLYPQLLRHRQQSDLEVRSKVRRLLDTLRENRCHRSEISALAISPDGRTIASACAYCRLTLWDGKTRRELLNPGRPLLQQLKYSPDGRLLACAMATEVRVYDCQTGKQRYRIAWEAQVQSLVFSPDEKLLVLGGRTGVLLYDISQGKKLGTLAHADHVSQALAYAPDGSWIASGGGRSVLLWSMRDRRRLRIYQGHRGWVTDVVFSPDSKRLVSSDAHGEVIFWKLPKK
ncbi:WD40 repeat domain-containing protein [Acidimicrobium ferrooxidans]|nr:WD40 repeat domain-containing protein [Acidimicrobium ferrooxidans]